MDQWVVYSSFILKLAFVVVYLAVFSVFSHIKVFSFTR